MERASAKVRESATPEQRKTMEAVDVAFAEVVNDLRTRHDFEGRLREWAEELTGFSMTVSEIEIMQRDLQRAKPGSLVVVYDQRGRGKSAQLYKTAFGTVDKAERYLQTLERTVIDITNNSQFTALGFRGLIALAFKRLLKRSK